MFWTHPHALGGRRKKTGTVLLISRFSSLSSSFGDTVIHDLVVGAGHTPRYAQDNSSDLLSQVNDVDCAIITGAADGPDINTRLNSTPTALIVIEHRVQAEMGLSLTSSPSLFNAQQITITNDGHPITAGYSAGTYDFWNTTVNYWTSDTPGAGAVPIASSPGRSGLIIYEYRKGAQLANGQPAAGARIGFHVGEPAGAEFTEVGAAMMNAAILRGINS